MAIAWSVLCVPLESICMPHIIQVCFSSLQINSTLQGQVFLPARLERKKKRKEKESLHLRRLAKITPASVATLNVSTQKKTRRRPH